MPLPKEGTTEWGRLAELYPTSTIEQREQWSKDLHYKCRSNFQHCMTDRKVFISIPVGNISDTSPKEFIYPVPKIELRQLPAHEETEKDEEQILLLSDEQIGLRTKTYNNRIAQRRYRRLFDTTCRFADIHRKFRPVRKLNIFRLGDALHGELIGKQIMLDELDTIDGRVMTLRDQKQFVVNETTNFVVNACQYYEEIEIWCAEGNHGIQGKQFAQTTHWGLEIDDLLKAAVTNYPQVKVNIVDDDFYFICKIKNTKFLGLHGDKIPMYLSLPWYGIDRRSLRWKQSLPAWDILCMGHFHSCSFTQPSGFPIFINGTMSSDSRYVAQWLGIKETAEMWTMFVGEKYGVTAMHKIDLMRDEVNAT